MATNSLTLGTPYQYDYGYVGTKIDFLQFEVYDTDVLVTDTSFNSASKVISAAFGFEYLSDYLGIGKSLFDEGATIEEVCTLVATNRIIEATVGDATIDWVNHVYENVFDALPSASVAESFATQIDSGTTTKIDLLILASEAISIDEKISLSGIHETGLAYTPYLS